MSNEAQPAIPQPLAATRPRMGSRFGRKLRHLSKEMWRYRLSYLFIAPFLIVFTLFIIVPVLTGVGLSFTYFNSIEFPKWAGWMNYQNLFSQDVIFLKHVIPNSFQFALFVGPIGYVLAFVLAWLIAQLPAMIRVWYALAMYAPSLTGGIAMVVVWQVVFTGDRTGYMNSFLLKWGLINQPILFTIDKDYLMIIMIIVSIWSSMGLGFLAILAGILNVDRTLYEAARIDGIRSRLQEIWYITIPMMKPQMLFAAVMAIVGTLKAGGIGTQLSGMNPTPDYSGQLFMNHIEDFGFTRLELGYASAISIALLIVTILLSRFLWMLLGPREDE
ncbi:MAG: sugar ABC transporter permease [Paenibacillus dendritiformis]|uniref:carbohydrate ABC transporter permease n=1 Tax=uncultured Paenibacillus sp. TaxID=227322 RepID=UPI0025CE2960|nr:sugar ABC transporter permease [uncultured Paenibacillus sp.]MDU5143276.1 sugar ABC transporter permease [Paenibacillus dendritiformis]